MTDQAYNHDLCSSTHKTIEKDITAMKLDIKKTGNRSLVIMTALCLNLFGIIAILITLLVKVAAVPNP